MLISGTRHEDVSFFTWGERIAGNKSQQTLMFALLSVKNIVCQLHQKGTAVAQWLRCYATNRKVAGSIQASVSGFFIDIKSFRSHYGLGVDSASNRNEYQEYFLGVKRPVRKADNLTTILCRYHEIWET